MPNNNKIRIAPPAGASNDNPLSTHCQICGKVVGTGITHCLSCRSALKMNTLPTHTKKPWGMIVLLLLSASAAALWYWQRTVSRSQLEEAQAARADQPMSPAPTLSGAPPRTQVTTPAAPASAPSQRTQVSSPPQQPHTPRQAPVTPTRPDTRAVRLTSTCRACGGSGRISQQSSTRTCPICRGTPQKYRSVSPTFTLCPTCAGFGSVLETRNNTRLKRTCRTCKGRGIIKKETR